MRITPITLTRFAALAAVAAGLLFIGVQVNHPHLDAETITTTEVMFRSSAKVLMAALALVGITGMYLRQVREAGLLGRCAMTSHTDQTIPSGTRSGPDRPGPAGGSAWGLPVALVLLSLVPVTAGVLRIVEIFGGPQLLPENPRVGSSPAPVVLHVMGAAGYALVGAFQFSARFRRRHPGWHRRAGRVLVGAGLVVAVSGLWLTLVYPGAPGGAWLWTVRLVVGSAMGASLVAGLSAIRRRDIVAHRAWMIRAYALGLGAGTQVFTETLGEAALGTGDVSKAVSLSAGWIINAAVAEWAIHRPVRPRRRSQHRALAPSP